MGYGAGHAGVSKPPSPKLSGGISPTKMDPSFAPAPGVSSTRFAPSSSTPTQRSGVMPCTCADADPMAATLSIAAVTRAMPIRRMGPPITERVPSVVDTQQVARHRAGARELREPLSRAARRSSAVGTSTPLGCSDGSGTPRPWLSAPRSRTNGVHGLVVPLASADDVCRGHLRASMRRRGRRGAG
jgi:hypothetical protein